MILSNIKSRKIKNIERNSSVSVLVDTPNPLRGILIYGTARIDYDNVYDQAPAIMETSHPIHGMSREKLQHFTKAYLDTFKTVVVRVTPKHITTFDYTKDENMEQFPQFAPFVH